MKRPAITPMPRAARASGMSARTAKEAAIHLVRLEFDRSRIEFGLRQAELQAERLRQEAAVIERRRSALLAVLNR